MRRGVRIPAWYLLLPAVLGDLDLEGVLIQAVGAAFSVAEGFSKRRSCAPHPEAVQQLKEQGADFLLTVKGNQKTLHRQIRCQFEGKRHIPVEASVFEEGHGRAITWTLRAKQAPEGAHPRDLERHQLDRGGDRDRHPRRQAVQSQPASQELV
jgi:hypothetical protein